MWVLVELVRLLYRILFGAALAIIFAGIWALASGGDFSHAMRIGLFLVGGLLLLLSGGGSKSTMTSRVINWGEITPGRGGIVFRGVQPKPGQPTLTANAVFLGSGAVLIVLGFVV
jgi:hypothetical protein